MKFPDPLMRGTLVRRYKRFLADVVLDSGLEVTAHCANPGTMIGLNDPGLEAWLSPSRNPARKLKYSWELTRVNEHLVGINTAHPNGIAEEAVGAGTIEELSGYASIRREVRYGGNSRIDLLLEHPERPPCYVEVKNVHLKRGPAAEFPDAVTARDTKHLKELSDVVAGGARAVMMYLVQRGDCNHFKVANDIDPVYDAALKVATAAGVEAICYSCRVALDGIEVDRPLRLALDGTR